MSDDEVRMTTRIDSEKKERLDNLLNVYNGLADADEQLTKSDLLRDCVDESIAELEDDLQNRLDSLEELIEGNPKTAMTAN